MTDLEAREMFKTLLTLSDVPFYYNSLIWAGPFISSVPAQSHWQIGLSLPELIQVWTLPTDFSCENRQECIDALAFGLDIYNIRLALCDQWGIRSKLDG